MKFVALVSGGKDSCFNILHCLKQGHELIALANLYPSSNVQELDSFMFQTVGFDIVAQYSKCIKDVPLFRQPIEKNTSKNVDLNYVETDEDEIEELYTLLSKIKEKFPDLKAVSVGAILSSYQRTRVENVCNRLNLVVLSYLWQRSQLELMNEMCSMSKKNNELEDVECAKLDAKIIKVATIGLDESHLGKSLPQILPTMMNLNSLYDVHICGEGGEFESMVIDAPFFNNGYLLIKDVVIDTESNTDGDGVFSVNLNVEFKERLLPDNYLSDQLRNLPVPPLLDEKWSELLDEIKMISKEVEIKEPSTTEATWANNVSVNQSGSLLYISNLQSVNKQQQTVEKQTSNIFEQLDKILTDHKLFPSQVINSNLILSDMSNFAIVNKVYNDFFDTTIWGPLPPSRSCIGSNKLGTDVLVQLSVIVDITHKVIDIRKSKEDKIVKIDTSKNGLHVQGRSYWAPCNIGPYSQAIWDKSDPNQISHISGQIALDPSNMSMINEDDGYGQSVLSLKHFETLKQTINTPYQLYMTCYISNNNMVDIVCNTWRLYSTEKINKSESRKDNIEDSTKSLIVVKISELPRGALCEWGGATAKNLEVVDDFDEDMDDSSPMDVSSKMEGLILTDLAYRNEVISSRSHRCYNTTFYDSEEDLLSFLKSLTQSAQVTLYFNPTQVRDQDALHSEKALYNQIHFVPVDQVFDYLGKEHKFGLHFNITIR